jgi:hypothetical protein
MKVTIFYRNSFSGGDGWTYYPMEVTIGNACPTCGAPRGVPEPGTVIEDGERYSVSVWRNECGHLDTYRDCYHEAIAIQAQAGNLRGVSIH